MILNFYKTQRIRIENLIYRKLYMTLPTLPKHRRSKAAASFGCVFR